MTQASGAVLSYRFPTLDLSFPSHIAAQSSLSFASTVFCKSMLQIQSLNTPVLKIPCRDEGVAEAPIFCPNSCQQLPQLTRGKWSLPSCKNNNKKTPKNNTSLLLITSQHNFDKVLDFQYILLSSVHFHLFFLTLLCGTPFFPPTTGRWDLLRIAYLTVQSPVLCCD